MENENIVTRIMEVVNKSGGNMSEFARKINVTPAYISKLGKQPKKCRPSALVINSICREFNVNETWLRTGEGEMFNEKDLALDALLADLLGEGKVTAEDRLLIKNFLELSDESRQLVIEFVKFRSAQFAASAMESQQQPDVEARLAELERQLAAEKARADRAEAEAREARAEAKARTDELLKVYREEDNATELAERMARNMSRSRSC